MLVKPTNLKLFFKLYFLLFLVNIPILYSQCNLQETIAICDMTVIDGDNDGTPDGVINLYDEYFNATGQNIEQGTWFDPNFGFVLDPNTGDVNLWDLNGSSENTDDYTYILFNNSCGNTPALTINVVLGPFSGFALPPTGPKSVNLQVCGSISTCVDLSDIDLFEVLQSDPSPHLNGSWVYLGNSPNFIGIEGSTLLVNIPYQQGPPLVDEETFELEYVVPGIVPCAAEQRVTVNISVVRQASSGSSNLTRICEEDLINGLYDADIVLSDNTYLIGEDIEGTWSGGVNTGNEISSPTDNTVNIKTLYDALIATNPRFGFQRFNFRYNVDQRSAVCNDLGSDIPFVIYEALRPFQQTNDRIICLDDIAPTTIDLFDELEFTSENGTTYEYKQNKCTNWELVSGPSDLGLQSHNEGICDFDPLYTPNGTVNLTNAVSGTYIFRYTVNPYINCNGNCSSFGYESRSCPTSFESPDHPCPSETALVTLIITEKLYAGEDTTGIELCDDGNAIDLISLLETNDLEEVYRGANGEWTDQDGNIVPNDFVALNIDGQQTFNFTYTTTNNGTCVDDATLSFTIFEEYRAGVGTSLELCNDAANFNLFDVLTGDKSVNGTWSGPNGYTALNIGVFNPAVHVSGNYVYTVPDNGPCPSSESIVTVTVYEKPNAGPNFSATLCKSDGEVNLFDLLDTDVDDDGEFVIVASNSIVPLGVLDLSSSVEANLVLEYRINRNNSCATEVATIHLQVMEVAPPPAIEDQSFCVLEAATLGDITVGSNADFVWYTTDVSNSVLPLDTVLQEGQYYVAHVDEGGCESQRMPVNINILNIGETKDCKPNMPDGVSPNNDGQNDTFDLSDLESAFPGFELSIYNRYGTLVYKGKSGTPYFSGLSNVSPSLGDNLPSGVYFYVFEPNDGINGAFQDSFYLSK